MVNSAVRVVATSENEVALDKSTPVIVTSEPLREMLKAPLVIAFNVARSGDTPPRNHAEPTAVKSRPNHTVLMVLV